MTHVKTNPAVDEKFLAQLVEHTVGQPGNKPISYVVVKEGIMEVRKNVVGTFARMRTRFDGDKLKDIFSQLSKWDIFKESIDRMLGTVETLPSAASFPAFQMSLPKIPVTILFQVAQFFKKVHEVHGTEAAALVRWSMEKKDYYVEIPEHKSFSGGGVQYAADIKNLDPIVLDLHSHHTMAPFFSGTDDGDEKSTALFGVVGYIEYGVPAVNIRARMAGEDIHQGSLRAEHIFDLPIYPPEWWEKVKEKPKEDYHKKSWDWSDKPDYGYGYGRHYGRDYESQIDAMHRRNCEELNQRTAETDDEYMQRLQTGRDTGVGDVPPDFGPSDAEFEKAIDEIVAYLITEIEDHPECFLVPENIAKLVEAITKELEDSAEEIAERCASNFGLEEPLGTEIGSPGGGPRE